MSTCCSRDRILREQRAVALEVDARVLEQRLVARELPFGLRELHLERPRVDLGEQSPAFTIWPSSKCTRMQLAVDARLLTVTV